MMSATSTGGRGILRRAGARGEHRQGIQGAGGSAQMPLRHMDINGGLLQIAVAEENLDGAQVGAGLQQMGGKAVTKGVRMKRFANAGALPASRQAFQQT